MSEIIHKRPSELKPYPNNPRLDGAEIEALEKSLKEYGFNEPIITNSEFVVCSGHKRLKAAENLGLETVPVIVNPDLDNPAKFIGYLIAANRTAEIARWDDGLRADLLRELRGLDGLDDLTSVGYDETELDSLIGVEPTEGNTDPDDVPDVAPNRVSPGDLWRLGTHRLICGDGMNADTLSALFRKQKASMVFTDPPYNVDYGASKNPRHKIRKIKNDALKDSDWEDFCRDLISTLKCYCPIGDIYVWGTPGPDGMRQRLMFCDEGFHWSATIIWKKQQLVLSPAKYQRIYEPCLYGWFEGSSYCGDRKQVEVWEFDRPHKSDLHPTMKPVDLCIHGIKNSTNGPSIVFDPFCGSGTTIIACEQTGRECYAVEIEPHYCDVIIQRWEDFTGEKAVKVD